MEKIKEEKLNDNFKPKVTLHNSFFWYLLGIVLLKPLQVILVVAIVIIIHLFGIKNLTVDTQQLVNDASYVISLVLMIIVVNKIVIKNEIKKHNSKFEK